MGAYAQAAEALGAALQLGGRHEQAERVMEAALQARIRSVGGRREHVAVAGALRRYAVFLVREAAARGPGASAAPALRAVGLAREGADLAAALLAEAEAPGLLTRVVGWLRPAGELGELARRVNRDGLRLESAACEATLGEALLAAGDAEAGVRVLQRTQRRLEAWIADAEDVRQEGRQAASRWLLAARRLRDSVGSVLEGVSQAAA